jgi:hypothetical protein
MPWNCDEIDILVEMILHRLRQFKAARVFQLRDPHPMTSFLLVMVQFKSN